MTFSFFPLPVFKSSTETSLCPSGPVVMDTLQQLTVGVVTVSSLDANLCDGADDAAVGSPPADQVHDAVGHVLDEGQTVPPVVCGLKRSGQTNGYDPWL